MTWSSRITVEAEAFFRAPPGFGRQGTGVVSGGSTVIPTQYTFTQRTRLAAHMGAIARHYDIEASPMFFGMGRQVSVAKGKSTFDVIRSVSITVNGVFRSARLERIEFVETIWDTP